MKYGTMNISLTILFLSFSPHFSPPHDTHKFHTRVSSFVGASTASAAAFAPGAAVLPRAAKAGAAGLCMSAGTGKPKTVAAFRAGNQGRSNVPTDPSSIDLDIVMGTKDRKDTVGGVDTTYQKPPSSFFSFAGQPSYSSVQSLCEKSSVCKLRRRRSSGALSEHRLFHSSTN